MSVRKNICVILIAGLLSLVLIESCKHEPLVVLPPVTDTTGNNNGGGIVDTGGTGGTGGGGTGGTNTDPCDPDSVYFETDVLPILISNCAKSGCHDAASHQEGVILTTYQNVMNTAEVEPFDLDDSELYEVITESDPDDRMPPPPNNKLTAEQISIIAKWINQGALNITCNANAGGCDTANVTYSGTIAPILQTYCTGCHSGATPSAGINLDVYGGVVAVGATGQLVGAITHSAGYTPMPLGGNMLPACEISQITKWVNDGMPDN